MRPQKQLGAVAKAVGGGYYRLQMPLKLASAVRGTVAGHRRPQGGGASTANKKEGHSKAGEATRIAGTGNQNGADGRACAWEAATIKGMAWPASPVATGCQGNPCSTGIRWGVPPAAQMGCLRNRSGSPSGADQPGGGKGHMVDGPDNAWRNRAPGPHAHGNTARQAMDGLWTEVCGQQKQSNDPGNNRHVLNTPITGRR